jgi:long-chain acyl-CoA synthetase
MTKSMELEKYFLQDFLRNKNDTLFFDAIEEREVSREQFVKDVFFFYRRLKEVGKNHKMIVLCENQYQILPLYAGIVLSQNMIVPVDVQKSNTEIRQVIKMTNSNKMIVDSSEYWDQEVWMRIDQLDLSKYTFTYSEAVQEISKQIRQINLEDASLMTFTSGSTGVPKGVLHSIYNLYLSAKDFATKTDLEKAGTFYHNFPMAYMAGILNLMVLPLVTDSKIVIDKRFDVKAAMNFWENPIRYQVTCFWMHPTMIALVRKLYRGSFEKIREAMKQSKVFCATAPLNKKAQVEFEEAFRIEVFESYGLSETLFLTVETFESKKKHEGVGERLDSIDIQYLEDGEICVKAPWMFKGYVHDGQEENFAEEYYRTGDIGSEQNGFLQISGRKKDMIIRGGINVVPIRMEALIIKQEILSEVCILGIEDEMLGEKIVCFYAKEGSPLDREVKLKIDQLICRELGNEFKIDEYHYVTEMPRNISAKVNRLELRRLYKEETHVF